MNRFHVHLNVTDLDTSVRFYSQLFAAEPTVLKSDYAKWMLDDPQGTRWETFHTHGEATTYYAGDSACATDGTACTPQASAMKPKIDKGMPCCAPQSACC